jgi:hypothetical protein
LNYSNYLANRGSIVIDSARTAHYYNLAVNQRLWCSRLLLKVSFKMIEDVDLDEVLLLSVQFKLLKAE